MKAVIFSDTKNNFNLSYSLKLLNKPILKYQIEYLKQCSEIETIIIVGNYLDKETRSDHTKYIFINSENSSIDLRIIKKHLDDQDFLLFYGNVLTKYAPSKLIEEHKKSKADISILYSEDNGLTGNHYLKIKENSEEIADLSFEKLNFDKICNNIFIVNPQTLAYVNDDNYQFFEKFIPSLIDNKKKLLGIFNDKYFSCINLPESYYVTQYKLLNSDLYPVQGTKINTSYYGNKCEIEFSVELSGRQFFGNHCTVGENSFLKENIIYDDVNIGKNCVIENSIIMNETVIGDNCEIKNSIIGENVCISNNVRIPLKSIITRKSTINKYSGVLNV